LQELHAVPPAGPVGNYLERSIAQLPRQESVVTGAVFSLGLGENSSAITILGDERVGAPNGSDADHFLRAGLSGYAGVRSGPWAIVASGAAQTDRYFNATNINQVDLHGSLQIDRLITERFSVGATFSDRHTMIDDEGYLNQFTLGPQIGFRISEQAALGLDYRYRIDSYSETPGLARLNRDAKVHLLTPKLDLRFEEGDVRIQIATTYSRTDARGADFDNDGLGLSLLASKDFGAAVRARVFLSAEEKRFFNPSVLSTQGAHRRDRSYYFQAYVQGALDGDLDGAEGLSVFAQFDRSVRASNVDFYDYEQSVFSAGVLYEF
ncbi:MAG: DUF2860 family protein, partial [Gammaproteobacteria bacterium]|nr:DUF2860 family protein [Gammaproteobacteria bacterium]